MILDKFRLLFTGVAIFLFSVVPVFAELIDITGIWEADDGESRYEVTFCGDGTQLCAKLIWIRPDVTNDRNRVYLNTYVVNKAKKYSNREWRGKIFVYGVTVSGNLQAFSEDRIMVRGCALLVICVRQGLTRIARLD